MKPSPLTAIPSSTSGRSPLEVALDAVHRAGDIILERFHSPKEFTFKGRADVVTNVDLLAEEAVLETLRREYPDFGIESEEAGASDIDSPYRWMVDPLDGTRNYLSGIPHFCITIALTHQGEVLIAVTYDPVRQELFYAKKGGGAYLNDAPISASSKREISQCLLGFDMGYSDERARQALELVQVLWPGMQSIRVMGSAALGLAYAACGRLDIYFHHHLSCWDIAAGLLLVREAGGLIIDRHGERATPKNDSIIASSSHLVQRFLEATERLEWRK